MIEIKDIRLLLPAMVSFKKDDVEQSVFVYIDQGKMDIVIPDTTGIENVEEFRSSFAKYYNSKNPAYKTPPLPKDMLNKINPKDFTERF